MKPTSIMWQRRPSAHAEVPIADLRAIVAASLDRRRAQSPDPWLAEVIAKAVAKYVDRGEGPWDVSVAAAATHLVVANDSILDLFVAEAGFAGAIDALLAADRIGRYGPVLVMPDDTHAWNQTQGFVSSERERGIRAGRPGLWLGLRRRLLVAPEEAYESGRAYAEALRGRAVNSALDHTMRSALAFAFPAEAAWAESELETAGYALALLVASVDRPELLEHLARHAEVLSAFHDGLVAMAFDRFGVAALPFLQRLLATHHWSRLPLASVVELLVQLDAPAVVATLVGLLEDVSVRDVARAYLRAHPAQALPALANRLAEKPDKANRLTPLFLSLAAANRPLATDLLASLPRRSSAVLASVVGETLLPAPSAPTAKLLATPLDDANAASAWASFVGWANAQAPASGSACVRSLVDVAAPATTTHLAELARTTANQGAFGCALAIVDALEQVGTPVAMRELVRMTVELADPVLSEHAEEALQRLQRRSGLDDEDVRDRTVPDYGLGGSSFLLDFGPRNFRVELDSAFKPLLFDSAGTPLRSLPRSNKRDDAAKAAHATAVWSRLKSEVTAEALHQARRFEDAMVERRQWPLAVLRTVVLGHPVLLHLAKLLLWSTASGTTFRVTEDASFADSRDEAITLEEDDVIHLTHRLELTSADAEAWQRLFVDYEILQPFEQLARAVAGFEDTSPQGIELGLASLSGEGLSLGSRQVLESRGWTDRFEYTHVTWERSIRGHEATLTLEMPDPDRPPTKLVSAHLSAPERGVDPIALSEVLRDLGSILLRKDT